MSQNGQTHLENLAAKCVWTFWDICIKGLMSLLVYKMNRIPTTAFTLPNYNCSIKFYFWWGERVKITPPLLGGFSEIINWLFIYVACEHQLLVKTQMEVQLYRFSIISLICKICKNSEGNVFTWNLNPEFNLKKVKYSAVIKDPLITPWQQDIASCLVFWSLVGLGALSSLNSGTVP